MTNMPTEMSSIYEGEEFQPTGDAAPADAPQGLTAAEMRTLMLGSPAAQSLPPITPQSTRKSPERQFAHKMRMLGKQIDRDRRYGEKPRITKMSRNEIVRRYGPNLARFNRWTGKPHEHAQATARRLRQQGATA